MLQINPLDAFLYLTDKSIQLYCKNFNYSVILEFAPEIVVSQEVIDKVKYEEMVKRFLTDNEIAKKTGGDYIG